MHARTIHFSCPVQHSGSAACFPEAVVEPRNRSDRHRPLNLRISLDPHPNEPLYQHDLPISRNFDLAWSEKTHRLSDASGVRKAYEVAVEPQEPSSIVVSTRLQYSSTSISSRRYPIRRDPCVTIALACGTSPYQCLLSCRSPPRCSIWRLEVSTRSATRGGWSNSGRRRFRNSVDASLGQASQVGIGRHRATGSGAWQPYFGCCWCARALA